MPNFLTRSKTAKFALGQPACLPLTCLPLEVDVYNAVIFTKSQMQIEANNNTVSNRSVFSRVAQDVKDIWEVRGNLPTISHRTILEKVEKVFLKGKDLQKISVERRSKLL